MKIIFIALFATLVSATILRQTNFENTANANTVARQHAIDYKTQFAFRCSPDLTLFNVDDPSNDVPLLDGWGTYRMPVTENNDSARIYFEQGINMYYGFHIIEALASFSKATRFDENFAMGYWGMALSYGPNINDIGYSASPEALDALQKAKAFSGNCTNVEKALIDAMQTRYSADTTLAREFLNNQYASAMKKVHESFPNSGDAAALYADALMVLHPWDLYDENYKPKSWTPAIVSTLEELVKEFPNHPGACHYYIHAVEGSEHPEKAIEVANRLGAMMPGVPHLVHMPSHIYIRSGYYKQGIKVNEDAVNAYNTLLAKYPPVVNNIPLYLIHNLHMQATCANMNGNFSESMKASNDCRNSFDSSFMEAPGYMGTYVQYIYMTPYFTLIRFGKWNDILNTPAIPDAYVYANIIWHYGRGLAYARMHDIANANKELDMLRAALNNPQSEEQLNDHPVAFNPATAGAGVAEKILQGVIAEETNDLDGAIDILLDAKERESKMLYNEPRDWVHPVREYLGEVYIRAKKYAEAERNYLEDLTINPHNGWSLTGLSIALEKDKKTTQAANTKTLAAKAFATSDTKITASVF